MKLLLIAAIIAAPIGCFHVCTGPLGMHTEECLPHIIIAMMAVAVHKLLEVKSEEYQATIVRVCERIATVFGRISQSAKSVKDVLVAAVRWLRKWFGL